MKVFSTIVFCLVVIAVCAAAEERLTSDVYVPHTGPRSIEVTETMDVMDLIQCLVGPEVTISNVSMSAAVGAAGTFSGGTGIIGFDSGIVLSTGNIISLVGPNYSDYTTFRNQFPGDDDLDELIPGYVTMDATVLEFDFECEGAVTASFQYVFASEEYNEYVDSIYNDVFAFYLNGVNIGNVPTVCSHPGLPVAINSFNCENPYNPPFGLNCDCYRNNDVSDGGGDIDTEMDGLSQVIFADGSLLPGVNHIKIAIADAGDMNYDSNVMIRCGSFTCDSAPRVGACCLPSGVCITLIYPDCYEQGGDFYGEDIPCEPNPCEDFIAACCFNDGSCQVIGEEGCIQNNGTWYPDWDSCEPNPCPQPTAVCCYYDGTCVINVVEECDEINGNWHPEWSSCDPNPCPLPPEAACCYEDGSCTVTTLADCDGLWMLNDPTCEPNPCPVSPVDDPSWGKIKRLYR
jgi:hypothetical protein